MADEIKFKFTNVTPGWVGAVVRDDDGKPHGIPVAPGESVWLTEQEQRLTAEAPVRAEDNPFIKAWEKAVDFNTDGEPTRWETVGGQLALAEDAPRPIMSERAMPNLTAARAALANQDAQEPAPEPQEEVTGAPELPKQPPVEGQPSPNEVIATPEAPEQNEEYVAEQARAAIEQAGAQEAQRAAATRAAKEDAALSGKARSAKQPAVV
ncbi:MAG: hypothetical protein NVS3B1_07900 [Marmoricola sp.]